MTDIRQLMYNPFTDKETKLDPYGRTAKKIYKYMIDEEGTTSDSVLPEDLNYNNGRFNRIKLQQDLSNVRRITYQQVKDIELIETYFRDIFSQYKGQTIKRIIKYTLDGEVIEKKEIVDIPMNYSSWWTNTGLHFLILDSETFIFSDDMNAGLDPKFQAQMLILSLDKVEKENYNQYFLDGVAHCFLHPIKNWANDCLDEAKSKSAKGRYSKIIKDVVKLEVQHAKGVSEDSIAQICNLLQIGIEIDLPSTLINKKTKYIEYQSHKKPLKVFKFINTRLNHIELNECKSKDEFVECDKLTLMDIYKNSQSNDEFVMWKESKDAGVNQVNTLSQVYKLVEVGGYKDIVQEFQNHNNLHDYKVSHYDNIALSNFLISNCLSNQSIILDAEWMEQDLEFEDESDSDDEDGMFSDQPAPALKHPKGLNHIDMKKSYSRAMDCPQYEGYLGKVSDFRRCNRIIGLGIYQVQNIKFNGNDLIENLKVFHDGVGYPSPELKYYQGLGITFDIIGGCWGSSFDIEFTDDMFKKEGGVSHYCKWYGTTCSHSTKDRFNFSCKDIEFAKLNAYNEKDADIRYNEYTGNGVIEYNKKAVYHQYHIGAFITSYARLNMFNQLHKFHDIKQIVAVQVDGIYYKGDVETTDLFVSKDRITIDSIETESYVDKMNGSYFDDDEFSGDFRTHNMVEVHTGAGGCGKTHLNLTDKGFQSILYVAPSWKLARTKTKEYDCKSSVFHYLLDKDPDKWKTIRKNYSTLIIDEISMLAEADKNIILKRFNKLKIIFCGDIGYQLPPVQGSEFILGSLPSQHHTTNHRCKCLKLANVLKTLRAGITDGNEFIDNSRSCYFGINVIESSTIDYNVKDLIITATHKQKDAYTERYKDKDKYVVLENSRDHSNGEIVYEKIPKTKMEMRHAFTIHSIQGETATETLFIDMNKMRSMRMLYTAISRAKFLHQIVFIRS